MRPKSARRMVELLLSCKQLSSLTSLCSSPCGGTEQQGKDSKDGTDLKSQDNIQRAQPLSSMLVTMTECHKAVLNSIPALSQQFDQED